MIGTWDFCLVYLADYDIIALLHCDNSVKLGVSNGVVVSIKGIGKITSCSVYWLYLKVADI